MLIKSLCLGLDLDLSLDLGLLLVIGLCLGLEFGLDPCLVLGLGPDIGVKDEKNTENKCLC